MFTDGLTERRDTRGAQFEDAGLWPTLEKLRDVPLDDLVRELAAAAVEHGGGGTDDIAVLDLRAEGTA
jgi:phosphoserine phosphatase RsbU/P